MEMHFGLTPDMLFQPHESKPWNQLPAGDYNRRTTEDKEFFFGNSEELVHMIETQIRWSLEKSDAKCSGSPIGVILGT